MIRLSDPSKPNIWSFRTEYLILSDRISYASRLNILSFKTEYLILPDRVSDLSRPNIWPFQTEYLILPYPISDPFKSNVSDLEKAKTRTYCENNNCTIILQVNHGLWYKWTNPYIHIKDYEYHSVFYYEEKLETDEYPFYPVSNLCRDWIFRNPPFVLTLHVFTRSRGLGCHWINLRFFIWITVARNFEYLYFLDCLNRS